MFFSEGSFIIVLGGVYISHSDLRFDIKFELFFQDMMTSSNGTIFRVTGSLCGEFTGSGEFPAQRPVTRSFDVFFDLRLNKRLSKQPWGWWFETPSWSLWHQCNEFFWAKTSLQILFNFCIFQRWNEQEYIWMYIRIYIYIYIWTILLETINIHFESSVRWTPWAKPFEQISIDT